MDENTKFDYYYGIEADQFSFYRVPRLLIKDERFKGLSSDAKLLYGLMLDRMSLSMKNGWQDVRQRGSHHRLVKGDKFEVIAVHGKDMPIGLLNAILKRTGLK